MRLRFIPALLLFSFIFLTACSPTPSAGQESPESAATRSAGVLATLVKQTLSARPTATPLPPTSTSTPTLAPATPTPTEPPVEKRTGYKLDVTFSFSGHNGRVAEEIQYTNRSGEALPELRLVVAMAAYRDLFNLTGLWDQDGRKIENYTWENVQIHVPLSRPLQPGESTTIKAAYDFNLPAQSTLTGDRPMPIGYTSRQANLVDWYPLIPPYRGGQGWLAYPPSYYGENLVFEPSDFEINLRLAEPDQGLVIAASAEGQPEGDVLRYTLSGARSFAFSFGSDYETLTAQAGKVKVTSYFFPMNDLAGQAALTTTVESVELYQELFGPYPHDTLAVVEADFLDGMEYDGLYFSSRAFYNLYAGKPDEYLVAIAAHETAHQWWYGVVGNDQANEPWLDEALSTYTEKLYYEHYYPDAVPWWWAYRIDYDRPHGWVDSSVYNSKGALQTYQDYRNAVYLNGAHFLEDLRKAMGDEAFFAFLKDYATQYAGKIALRQDFFTLLAKHTPVDLKPLLTQYFQNP